MANVSVRYLIIGGGGGNSEAGGGAGGLVRGNTTIDSANTYTIVVGALAGGNQQFSQNGNNGADTTAFGFTALGGGGGGGGGNCSCSSPPGSDGGSGGGGSFDNAIHPGGNATQPGSASGGFGNAGGRGICFTGQGCWVGGGGGAGGAAPPADRDRGPTAGLGLADDITGTSINYATGGGNAPHENTPGSGGTNDGIVIVRYTSNIQLWDGGTVTTVGGDFVHSFGTSGTLSPKTQSVDYWIVAGGGGGGTGQAGSPSFPSGGGGGAGGLLQGTTNILQSLTYDILIGAGGAGATGNNRGTNGTNSTALGFTAIGGGGGGQGDGGAARGADGGSGGGGAGSGGAQPGGAGTAGQGNAGGSGQSGVQTYNAGSGGGAGGVGQDATTGSGGIVVGGAGLTNFNRTNTALVYAQGGGARVRDNGSAGNNGATPGSGGEGSTATGGTGAAGIVIISYVSPIRLLNGGTVTSSGSGASTRWFNTFTSAGQLSFAYVAPDFWGYDYSGRGNDWVPVNFFTAANASFTSDWLSDVTTSTNATTANYPVANQNVAVNSKPTITDGNLTIVRNADAFQNAFATFSIGVGSFYWESFVGATPSSNEYIGISTQAEVTALATQNQPIGFTSGGYAYNQNGQIFNNNTGTNYGAALAANNVVGIALNLATNRLYIAINNVWQNSADPVAGTGGFVITAGTYFPSWTVRGAGYNWQLNFGQQPFVYAPPTGYARLNLFTDPGG